MLLDLRPEALDALAEELRGRKASGLRRGGRNDDEEKKGTGVKVVTMASNLFDLGTDAEKYTDLVDHVGLTVKLYVVGRRNYTTTNYPCI